MREEKTPYKMLVPHVAPHPDADPAGRQNFGWDTHGHQPPPIHRPAGAVALLTAAEARLALEQKTAVPFDPERGCPECQKLGHRPCSEECFVGIVGEERRGDYFKVVVACEEKKRAQNAEKRARLAAMEEDAGEVRDEPPPAVLTTPKDPPTSPPAATEGASGPEQGAPSKRKPADQG